MMAADADVSDSAKSLEDCAHDLISAVQANDVKGVAAALQAAYDVCEGYEDAAIAE